MKKSQLKKLIKEVIVARLKERSEEDYAYDNPTARHFDRMLDTLTTEQKKEDAYIFKLFDEFDKEAKKEGSSLKQCAQDVKQALKWNEIDTGILEDYFNDMAGASGPDDPFDDRDKVNEMQSPTGDTPKTDAMSDEGWSGDAECVSADDCRLFEKSANFMASAIKDALGNSLHSPAKKDSITVDWKKALALEEALKNYNNFKIPDLY